MERMTSDVTEHEYDRLLNLRASSNPWARQHDAQHVHATKPFGIVQNGLRGPQTMGDEYVHRSSVKRRIYWLPPTLATLLLVLGLGAAIGHCVFFAMIKERPIGEQTWTLRYSLALAFVFKSSLAASISIAISQQIWMVLQRSKSGTPLQAIDAMFSSGTSVLSFLSPSLWVATAGTGLMAACIWLMPLTALVAPTALTVGTAVVDSAKQDCVVPTIHWGRHADYLNNVTTSYSLYTVDYTGSTYRPSTNSKRIVDSVLENGRRIPWQSPCGQNCSYGVAFAGPSWKCTAVDNVEDTRAPWERNLYADSYWYGTKASSIITPTSVDSLFWSPVYHAGYNYSTNQFWAGYGAGFARGLQPWNGFYGKTLQEALDIRAYYCQIWNSSYNMHVEYHNGIQSISSLQVKPFAFLNISRYDWMGSNVGQVTGTSRADVTGLYTPMINTLSGELSVDPHAMFVGVTSLGLVPSLITNVHIDNSYGFEPPYIPRDGFGALLEELSHNLTISLMSNQQLGVVNSTRVSCHGTITQTVWKVSWVPIVTAYAAGIGAALICLAVGGYALVVNGVAHDTSFSSVLRTTRNEQLVCLADAQDTGALPLDKRVKTERLRFVTERSFRSGRIGADRKNVGFML